MDAGHPDTAIRRTRGFAIAEAQFQSTASHDHHWAVQVTIEGNRMSHRATPTWRRTGPPLVVGRAHDRRGEPNLGERVKVWRVEVDKRHIYLGEGRLRGWLHRARFYEQHEGRRTAPYFIVESAVSAASRDRDVRMPVAELTRPYPPRPPPESPVYPHYPECGGALGLAEYEAEAGLIRCYGFGQTCATCGSTGLWGSGKTSAAPRAAGAAKRWRSLCRRPERQFAAR